VKIVVLDEADRMLDLGFIHDVTKILTRLPADRQTLLFSATVSGEVAKLAGRFLRNPRTLEVGERRSPGELVKQHFYAVPPEEKLNLLVHALSREKMESVLVFSRTKHGADKISRRLEKKGISSAVLHSNRTQGQRQRALEGFRSGRYRILVATDIAARGIDVDGISHVINYDIPQYAEDYVHRIGRTGRAGATGDAMTLVGPGDRQYLKRIEAYTGKTLHVKAYPDFQAAPRQVSPGPRPQHHQKGKAAVKRPPRRSHHASSDTGAKKKKTAPRMETFSSDGGGAWSNY
jgi:ATP-dependent RNA helicase RhlE